MLKEILKVRRFASYIPLFSWVASYDRNWLRDDLIAGLVGGAVMIPMSIGYAQMAGVEPQAGLYAAIVGMTAYAILATSRHVKTTASSTMAIMSIAVIAPLAVSGYGSYLALSSALALTMGIIMIALAVLKLGFISDFLSKSVMTGYIFGVACLIAITQLPKVFGVPVGSGTFFQQLGQFVSELPATNVWSLALGVGTVVLIRVAARRVPLIPGALVALALGILLSSVFNLAANHAVEVIGQIPIGMSSLTIPRISLRALPYIIAGGAGLVFLAVGETLGTARTFAAKHHYDINADQEVLALGVANVGAGLFQGIAVDMSLPSTVSGEAAGEHTQLSSLVSAGIVLAAAMFLSPLLRDLPVAVLGAIVLVSIRGLFNIAEFQRFYRQRKTDFWLAIIALLGVLGTSVMAGMVIAVLLSVVMLLYRASRPYIAFLGRRPDSPGEYVDRQRHPDGEPIPGLVILRLDAPLYFFNANVARSQILAQITAEPPPQAILIDLGASADLDIGTSDMLGDLISDLRLSGVDLYFSQVSDSVQQRMEVTGLLAHVGADHIFASIDVAVNAFLTQPPALPALVDPGVTAEEV